MVELLFSNADLIQLLVDVIGSTSRWTEFLCGPVHIATSNLFLHGSKLGFSNWLISCVEPIYSSGAWCFRPLINRPGICILMARLQMDWVGLQFTNCRNLRLDQGKNFPASDFTVTESVYMAFQWVLRPWIPGFRGAVLSRKCGVLIIGPGCYE